MCRIKKYICFLKYIKCLKLVLKHLLKTVFTTEKMLWRRNKDVKEKIDGKNLYHLTDKEIKGRF